MTGKPRVVVNADDLGMSPGTTAGIVRSHLHGVVTSASLVVTTPAYADALAQLAHCPDLGVGLHFSLSAGRPLSPAPTIPLLIGSDGYFALGFVALMRLLRSGRRDALLEQIRIELTAQFDRLERDGVRADHVNGERHVHLIPGIFELVVAAAAERSIRHVRLIEDVGVGYLRLSGLWPMLRSGGPIKFALLRALSARARRCAAGAGFPPMRYATLLCTGRMDLVLGRILADPPAGLTEVAVHPGLPEREEPAGIGNPALLAYLRSEDRRREMQACVDCRKLPAGAELVRFADIGSRTEARP